MTWVALAAFLAGLISGFAAGASPAPTGGSVATAVAAFLVGVVGGVAIAGGTDPARIDSLGRLAVLFLGTLALSYVGANVLRKRGLLEWMGMSGPGRK